MTAAKPKSITLINDVLLPKQGTNDNVTVSAGESLPIDEDAFVHPNGCVVKDKGHGCAVVHLDEGRVERLVRVGAAETD